ncbi:hypothetical protein MHBO_003747 [Bonamia ostreae]|uniref:Uncharacterized protein n=1 Tax=Bonamia ostreae TaxID=126728 RepID=A0ABV2ARS3_9EUKA
MPEQKTYWDIRRVEGKRIVLELFDQNNMVLRMAEKFLKNNAVRARLSATFRPESGKKTNPQMRYYRGHLLPCIHDAMVELGNNFEIDQTHDLLKDMFYNERMYIEGLDQEMKIHESLASAGKERMSKFINKCFVFAREDLGILVHTPEEYYSMIKKLSEKK